MLKSTLNTKENVNIREFTKLIPYLKSKSVGYRPKKSRILTKEEFDRFLQEAPDNRLLLEKVPNEDIPQILCFTSDSRKFFVKYVREKCVNQVVGVNKIRNVPKEIVTYLNLPHPETYTEHCFRRSSATLLADAGADVTIIKRHGGSVLVR